MRAAASSIASGSPSRRAQMPATAAALSAVSAKSGLRARARAMKRRTASSASRRSRLGSWVGSGTARGSTPTSCSAVSASRVRLVAKMHSRGAAASRAARSGAASKTCSQLSNTSKSCRSARYARRRSATGRWPAPRTPRRSAIVGTTSSGSRMGVRSTKAIPSAKSAVTIRALSRATRVLPTPAGPVRVRRRTSPRRTMATTAATSCSRPTNGVAGSGSGAPGSTSSAASAWKSAGRAAASSAARSVFERLRASASMRTVSSRGALMGAALQIADGPHAQPSSLGQLLLGQRRRGAVPSHEFA